MQDRVRPCRGLLDGDLEQRVLPGDQAVVEIARARETVDRSNGRIRRPELAVDALTAVVASKMQPTGHCDLPVPSGRLTMFVQVIQGKVSDAEQVHQQFDKWSRELAPGATGWLGSTAGVTDDGSLVAFVRFDSEEHARQNSSRPEQDSWWSDTSRLFTTGAEFMDSTDVTVDVPGNPDSATFVQIIEGRTTDPERGRELATQNTGNWAEFRPDMLGSVEADFPGGAYAMELFFTSEAEARVGEKKEPPPELKAQMDEMNALNAEPPTFYDLKNPWIYSPQTS
jgi:hypothetical protein